MKKFLAFLAISAFLAACGGGSSEKSATEPATTDTTAKAATPAPDTTAAAAPAPAPVKDSVMQFKDGKVMIMVGGNWSELKSAVTTSNGRKVSPNGEVSKNGKKRKLEEGMMIDKDGQLMDKDGKLLDNTGWE